MPAITRYIVLIKLQYMSIANLRTFVIQVQFDHSPSPYRGSHQPDPYLKLFNSLRNELAANLEGVIPVQVIPKPPPKYYKEVASSFESNLYLDTRRSRLVHYPRKDSFEITVDNFLVFSRLQTGRWPQPSSIVEWVFKVSEKIIDSEIERQTNPSKQVRKTIIPRHQYSSNDRSIQNLTQMRKNQSPKNEDVFDRQQLSRKLPILYSSNQQPVPSNPFGASRSKMRYSDLRKQGQQSIHAQPLFLDSSAFRTTKKPQQRRKFSNQPQTISYSYNKSPVSRNESPIATPFHWNFDNSRDITQQKRNINMQRTTLRLNHGHPRQAQYRRKNIQLQPLSHQMIKQRDRIKSMKQRMGERPLKKIIFNLSNSVLNCFQEKYVVEGNRVAKKKKMEGWHPVLGETALPLKGQYYLSVLVLRSKQNKVQIGLAPLTYYPTLQKAPNSQGLLCFDYNSGCIRDCKLNDTSYKTQWRHGGQPAPLGKFLARMVVDMQSRFVDWYADEKICASAKLPLFFGQGCRGFISLGGAGDLVLLNDQVQQQTTSPHKEQQDKAWREQIKTPGKQGQQPKQDISDGSLSPNGQNTQRHRAGSTHANVGFGGSMGASMITSFTQTTPHQGGRIKRQRNIRLVEQAINTLQSRPLQNQQPLTQIKAKTKEIPFEDMQGIRWQACFDIRHGLYEVYQYPHPPQYLIVQQQTQYENNQPLNHRVQPLEDESKRNAKAGGGIKKNSQAVQYQQKNQGSKPAETVAQMGEGVQKNKQVLKNAEQKQKQSASLDKKEVDQNNKIQNKNSGQISQNKPQSVQWHKVKQDEKQEIAVEAKQAQIEMVWQAKYEHSLFKIAKIQSQ